MASNADSNGSFMSKPCPLRPWPIASADHRPKDIAEYITQVNRTYPGGFRALRSANLKDDDDPAAHKDTVMADADGDEENVDLTKDPVEARNEAIKNIVDAHNSALLALDVVSLLLSKESPSVAGTTMQQGLRELVGIGTLGSQKHAESNLTTERINEFSVVSDGWNVLAIDDARDSIGHAASVLEKEVSKEAKYWDDILSVKEDGWSMCRMPRERQTLGVRFGFNEANPEFSGQSLAPMRRTDDGSAELDLGMLGGQAQRLVVTFERDGKVTGISSLAPPFPDDGRAPLSLQVLEARNTIFSRELWHELQMESRTLLSYGVKQYETIIIYTTERGLRMKLELLSLNRSPQREQILPDDTLAESIHIALHLLLGHAHRQNETLRTRPAPPHQPRSRTQNQYHLLRPVIARMVHMDAIQESTKYIGNLVQSLRNAKIADSRFELITTAQPGADLRSAAVGRGQISPSQLLLNSMLSTLFFAIDFTITLGNRMSIIGQTWLMPATTTVYQVNLKPSHHSETPNTLLETCPPHHNYPSLAELRHYVNRAAACAVTSFCHRHLEQAERAKQTQLPHTSDDEERPEGALWHRSVIGTSLSTSVIQQREIRFEVTEPDESPQLTASTAIFQGDSGSTMTMVRHVWNAEGTGANARGVILPNVCSELVKRAYR